MMRVENLRFAYRSAKGPLPVFDGLSVDFAPGLSVILGPNGAGKSTLLKCMFGLLRAQGEILYGDTRISNLNVSRRAEIMSYLPQSEADPGTLRVLETVLLGRLPELTHRVRDEDLNAVMDTLRALDIGHLALRKTGELSGGQQKLVYVAQTLVRKPQIILMDEPFGSLDLQKQLELCRILRELTGIGGLDLIMIVHDLNLAARHADYIAVIDVNGRLYAAGAPREVITEPMLRDVYGIVAHLTCDDEGVPVVSPIRSIGTGDCRKPDAPSGGPQ